MQNFNRANAYLTIDYSAIEKNLNTITKKVKNVMPMVKANAYGTDAVKLSKFYQSQNVPIIGVSHVNEAVLLREKGISLPIFVIHVPPFEAKIASKYDLDAAVSTFEEAKALSQAGKDAGKQLRVHLCVNTGMNRFGIQYSKGQELAEYIQSLPFLQLEGIMTHFACADRPDLDSVTHEQISLFQNVVEKIHPKPKWIHAANSFAALRFDIPFCNLARVGLALFGFGENLEPSLTLESHLAFLESAKKGEWIGYNCQYKVQKENFRFGVIPMGYHDGLHRHYFEKGFVLIRRKKAPMIGHICMDFMMIDLTDIEDAAVFDPVILFNTEEVSPIDFAAWGNTDVRELLACLGPRIKRQFTKRPLLRKKDEKERITERLPSSFDPFKKDQITGQRFTSP